MGEFPHRRQATSEHGTTARYQRHWREGDVQKWNEGTLERCQPCTNAMKEQSAFYHKTKRKDKPSDAMRAHDKKLRQRAYYHAMQRLRQMYETTFHGIYYSELSRIRKENPYAQEPTPGV